MLYLTKQNYLMYRLANVTGKSRFLGGEAVLFSVYFYFCADEQKEKGKRTGISAVRKQEEEGCGRHPFIWLMKTERMEEFERTGLLLGNEGLERLGKSTVAVFGVGGVGSHCIEALARSGVGKLILADSDVVSRSNINRQSVAFQQTIGLFKTKVMEEMIRQISPETEVVTIEAFVLPDNLEELLAGVKGTIDYIVDAIDTVTAKLALAEYAQKYDIPLIASMGTGNKLYPELFQIADISETSVCPLCRVMRRELKKRGIEHLKVLYSRETPLKPQEPEREKKESEQIKAEKLPGTAPRKRAVPGSVSFVPPVAGMMLAGCVIRSLAGIDDNL